MTATKATTYMGIDLAGPGSDRTVITEIRDLGIRVEEAPAEPATSKPNTVTIEQIESLIVNEDYIQGINGSTLTLCILTLANGFDVVGQSGCNDPANYDAQLGRKYAREDAIEKIWPLEGYLLRQRMWEDSAPVQEAPEQEDLLYRDSLGIDGAKWAEAFRRTAIRLGYSRMDEGWLIGWFCNAVMAGYDEARRRYEPQDVPACEPEAPRQNDYSRPMAAQDAPVTASAAVEPEAVADALEYGELPASVDTDWRRLRAIDLAQASGVYMPTDALIQRARDIDAYLLGEGENIDAARVTLMNAVLRGNEAQVDQAGNVIEGLWKWLNDHGWDGTATETLNPADAGQTEQPKRVVGPQGGWLANGRVYSDYQQAKAVLKAGAAR